MPGILKVGMTNRTPDVRAKELHTTGVPLPFNIEFAKKVTNPKEKEKTLHKMVCEHLDWLFKTVAVTSTERTLTVNPHNILYNGFLIYKLIDTPPLPRQSILRISSAKRPTTRKTTSLRKRSIKSSSRKRLTIG
jgi:hypothetical protein